jgi:transcriptional regulator GlxA family with amidase domain
MSDSLISVGLVIFDEVEELDFVGPWEVLTMAGKAAKLPIACRLVARSPDPVTCAKGMRVLPDATFAGCGKFDVILVPGGQGTRRLVDDRETLDFVAAQGASARWVTSVCTGSAVLGAAGLIGKRRATTHWAAFDFLASQAPEAEIVRDARVVEDGNLMTSAGVSAGIDMALTLLGRLFGPRAALGVQKGMEYYPRPPFATAPQPS